MKSPIFRGASLGENREVRWKPGADPPLYRGGRREIPLVEAGKVLLSMNLSQKTCHGRAEEDDGKVLRRCLRTLLFEGG